MNIQPVTLAGQTIRLEPLSEAHVADLAQVGCDEIIWRYMLYGKIENEADMHAWVLDMLERQLGGADLPFAVILQESGRAVGATRYLEIRLEHRGLEIGGTWYGMAFQRTAVNTEAKYLLLRHAFESLGCMRVQFKQISAMRGSASPGENWGYERGHPAQAYDYAGWNHTRLGLLQCPRQRMAGG